jgi:hypothetical protein
MSDDPDLALPGPRAPERLPLGVLHAPLARGFFGCTCVVSLVAAALVAGTQMGAHSGTVAALLVLNGLASLAALATPKHRLALAMTLSTVFGMVLIAVIALALEGPRAPHGLPLYGLMVYLLFSAAGRRAGVFGAAVALACLAVVHLSPWAPPPLADGLPVGLGAQLLGLAAGTFGGWVAVRLIERQTRLSDDREARFRQLLGVAADLYWESDRQHRIVVLAYARSGEPVPNAQRFLGQLPWRLPGVAIDADALDTLLADIGRDEAFAGVPLAFAEPGAPPRHWAVSGEPRHDAKGICTGYCGAPSLNWPGPARAIRSSSDEIPARWCCIGAGACSTPIRRRCNCLDSRAWRKPLAMNSWPPSSRVPRFNVRASDWPGWRHSPWAALCPSRCTT